MSWRLSGNLDAIRTSIWNHFGGHVLIGTIGDTSHQGTISDHNPDNRGIVCAIDIMYSVGPNASACVRALVGRWDLAYVIHNRTIWSAAYGWKAREYKGSDPHTNHVHASSLHTAAADNNHVGLNFGGGGSVPAPVPTPSPGGQAPPFRRLIELTNPMMSGDDIRQWQQKMKDRGWSITVDGIFGPGSRTTLVAFQRQKGLLADGKLGPKSWAMTWNAPVTSQ